MHRLGLGSEIGTGGSLYYVPLFESEGSFGLFVSHLFKINKKGAVGVVANKFFYMVQPGGLRHLHIYELKLRALKDEGIDAHLVSFVSNKVYTQLTHANKDICDRITLVRIPFGRGSAIWKVIYFMKALIAHDVVIQALCTKPPALAFLRRYARIIRHRFTCLIEMEGDAEAEADYLAKHPYKKSFYEATLRGYQKDIVAQRDLLNDADGFIFMSNEHRQLWAARLGRMPRSVVMSAVFDPKHIFFDAKARTALRSQLGIQDQIVLVYSGSVLCSWQRFGSTCRMLRGMKDAGLNTVLLALVHTNDHAIAREFADKYAVGDSVHLLFSPANEMSRYLSAADIGMFLRAEHLMNRIVTSAKLGEYLACGLPILTTGVSARYHDYVRERGCGLFVNDTRAWDPEDNKALRELVAKGRDDAYRTSFSQSVREAFCGSNGELAKYVTFVKQFL